MKNLTATLYDRIGNVYWDLGDHDKALEFFNRVINLSIKGEYDDERRLAYTFNNMGNVYRFQGNNPEALNYYSKSLVLSKKLKIKLNEAMAELNIADIFLKTGKNEQSLKIYKKYEEPVRMGNYYLVNKDYQAALENFKKALNDQKLRGNYSGTSPQRDEDSTHPYNLFS